MAREDPTVRDGRAAPPPETAPLPKAGALLADRYRVVRALGAGGFGAVVEAKDQRGGRSVALKVLHPDLVKNPTMVERFEREAALAQRLRHPHTVVLYDYGRDGGVHFIVYELLSGRTLATQLRSSGAMPLGAVVELASQVLRSLAEAHALGIVHRDIKPANVFLAQLPGDEEVAKVLDFGIAKDLSEPALRRLTDSGYVLGTPRYMAPEQLTGRPAVPASDLYAVGLLMAEALEGRPVFAGDQLGDVQRKLDAPAAPLSEAVLASALGPMILRATQRDPKARFSDAKAMLAALDEAITGRIHAAPTAVDGEASTGGGVTLPLGGRSDPPPVSDGPTASEPPVHGLPYIPASEPPPGATTASDPPPPNTAPTRVSGPPSAEPSLRTPTVPSRPPPAPPTGVATLRSSPDTVAEAPASAAPRPTPTVASGPPPPLTPVVAPPSGGSVIPPPPRRRTASTHTGWWLLGGAVVLAVIVLAVMSGGDDDDGEVRRAPRAPRKARSVAVPSAEPLELAPTPSPPPPEPAVAPPPPPPPPRVPRPAPWRRPPPPPPRPVAPIF